MAVHVRPNTRWYGIDALSLRCWSMTSRRKWKRRGNIVDVFGIKKEEGSNTNTKN